MMLSGRQGAIALLLLSLQGCANYGNEVHMRDRSFETRPAPIETVPDRGTVVVVREKPFIANLSYLPWDAFPIAVDGKMVALLPVGSSVVLSLQPGTHTMKWAPKVGGRLTASPKSEVVAVAVGQTVFLSIEQDFTEGAVMKRVAPAIGHTLYEGTAPARLLHNGATWEAFQRRIEASNRSELLDSINAAMPSGQTVGAALEAIGSIALIGLDIAVIASNSQRQAAAGVHTPIQSAANRPSSALRMDTLTSPSRPDRFSYGSSGGGDVLRAGSETRLRDYRTGTVYTVQDGVVRGSDGSRFKVVGSAVISDSGVRYEIIGNTLRSPDGRTCRRVVDAIHCD